VNRISEKALVVVAMEKELLGRRNGEVVELRKLIERCGVKNTKTGLR